DPLIAADARDRRFASGVAVDKIVNHGNPEATLVIEHIMRDAEALGDPGSIIDVAAGAAGAFAPRGRAMIVELQSDADNFKPAVEHEAGVGNGLERLRFADHRRFRQPPAAAIIDVQADLDIEGGGD